MTSGFSNMEAMADLVRALRGLRELEKDWEERREEKNWKYRSPLLPKIQVMPFHFYKRPAVAPDFASQKTSKDGGIAQW